MAALPERFYLAPTLEVTRNLLGKILVHDSPAGKTAGRIVEVEAYCGTRDRAAHSFGGRRSPRNEVMYGPPGRAYVYFVYGMYFCMNVVCQPPGVPEAVLIRALEPLEGLELMAQRRGIKVERCLDGQPDPRIAARLCRGPGALCQAMGIDRSLNGASLVRGPLHILDASPVPDHLVGRAPRVGVDYAGAWARKLWRFLVLQSPYVSRPPRAPRR